MNNELLVVHVQIRVKAEHVTAFLEATLENARRSVEEPGVLRFDIVRERDEPTRFVLVEVYRDPSAPAAHKATAHYATWRDTVEPMMAEPRTSRRFDACFPDIEAW